MKKVITILLIMTMVLIPMVGCDKDENKGKSNKDSDVQTKSEKSKDVKKSGDKYAGKNNSEKLMNLMLRTGKKKEVQYEGMFLIGTLAVDYKKNIKNSVTGSTDIYAIDRAMIGMYNSSDIEISQGAHVIADSGAVKIDDPVRGQEHITYACNKKSAGGTVGLILYEHYYTYEIDKNGKKINELVVKVRDMTKKWGEKGYIIED